MADNTQKKAANLTTFGIAQDYLPEHWDWDPSELKSLGNLGEMAKVILARLQAAGVEVTEAHVIEHAKDEHELWNEYQNQYQVLFTSNHMHMVCKLSKGEPLENIAKIIGIAPNFIAKPKAGRYSYDNMLSYLIHIKYPKKYQYDPHDVITIVGKGYIEYFRECHRRWMHGRAVKIIAEAEYDLNDVKRMIMEGEIGELELLTDKRFEYVYQLHMKKLDKMVEDHISFTKRRERAIKKEGKFSERGY